MQLDETLAMSQVNERNDARMGIRYSSPLFAGYGLQLVLSNLCISRIRDFVNRHKVILV